MQHKRRSAVGKRAKLCEAHSLRTATGQGKHGELLLLKDAADTVSQSNSPFFVSSGAVRPAQKSSKGCALQYVPQLVAISTGGRDPATMRHLSEGARMFMTKWHVPKVVPESYNIFYNIAYRASAKLSE